MVIDSRTRKSKMNNSKLSKEDIKIITDATERYFFCKPEEEQGKAYLLEAINNEELVYFADLLIFHRLIVNILKDYNRFLSNAIKEELDEEEKNELRPTLRRCNSLWRAIDNYANNQLTS